jgi:hypothetical protein
VVRASASTLSTCCSTSAISLLQRGFAEPHLPWSKVASPALLRRWSESTAIETSAIDTSSGHLKAGDDRCSNCTKMTTSQGGTAHSASSRKATTPSAKSAGANMALVHTGV